MNLSSLLDFILNIDVKLSAVIAAYGVWTYLLLFAIVFCETGLVVTPFLPGDSLLFASGVFAAQGDLEPFSLFIIFSLASILGDALNYQIGKKIGPVVFKQDRRFIKKDYLEHAQTFYEKHGARAIVIARFMPILRTFAPFVAGVGQMKYSRFILYNVIGGVLWAGVFVFGGYFFGNIPFVQTHFSEVILGIILLSLIPAAVEYARHRKNNKRNKEIA